MTVTEPASFRGYPVDELIDDFRLACVSRGIDDREITMQKQSRVFFQISGAGADHPFLAHVKEGRYLKAVFCRVF